MKTWVTEVHDERNKSLMLSLFNLTFRHNAHHIQITQPNQVNHKTSVYVDGFLTLCDSERIHDELFSLHRERASQMFDAIPGTKELRFSNIYFLIFQY